MLRRIHTFSQSPMTYSELYTLMDFESMTDSQLRVAVVEAKATEDKLREIAAQNEIDQRFEGV